MNPLYLLRVVVDKFLDVGLDEANFRQDLVGGSSPGERFGVSIPVGNVVAYLLDEDSDTVECAAADGLTGDDAEPGLDLIEPGPADRSEVEVNVRIFLQPDPHLRDGVSGQVVQDDMNVLAGVRFHGFLEKCQEVIAVAGWFALAEDLAGADIQCREQIRCAVPTVVMSAFLGGVERDR